MPRTSVKRRRREEQEELLAAERSGSGSDLDSSGGNAVSSASGPARNQASSIDVDSDVKPAPGPSAAASPAVPFGSTSAAPHDIDDDDDDDDSAPPLAPADRPPGPYDREFAVWALEVASVNMNSSTMKALRDSFTDLQQIADLLAEHGNTLQPTACLLFVAAEWADERAQRGLASVKKDVKTDSIIADKRHVEAFPHNAGLVSRVTALEHGRVLRRHRPAIFQPDANDNNGGASTDPGPGTTSTANPSPAPIRAQSDRARILALEKGLAAEKKLTQSLQSKLATQGTELAQARRDLAETKADVKTLVGIPKLFANVMTGQTSLIELTSEMSRMGLN